MIVLNIDFLRFSELDKYRAGFQACIKEAERYLSFPDINSAFVDSNREHNLRLLRHLEACLLEVELKNIPIAVDIPFLTKGKVSAKGKYSPNSQPKSHSANKFKPAPKPAEPPLVATHYLDEPLDYSMSTAIKCMEAMREPIAQCSSVRDEKIDMSSLYRTKVQMGPLPAFMPSTSDMQLVLPMMSAAAVMPQSDPPSDAPRFPEFLPDDNENAMDDTEWKFKELRKVLLGENDLPSTSTSCEVDVKAEMAKFEEFEAMSPPDFGNIEDMDEAIDIKAHLDDPMWRPW